MHDRLRYWSSIIHIFSGCPFFSLSATIFSLTVGSLALGGLTEAMLSVTMRCTPAGEPACIAAIGLASKTTPADAEGNLAPAA